MLTPVVPDGLHVLLVRRTDDVGKWSLPGTFLHEGETLADAVLRSLDQKAHLTGQSPRQLHVFDASGRDDRGWVLSVAHVVLLAAHVVLPVVESHPADVRLRPVAEAVGLPFDHDDIVRRAVATVRQEYAERPDPERLLTEPFTLRQLRVLHEAVVGGPLQRDVFRRRVRDHLLSTQQKTSGEVGKPAELFRHA
ncbi:NrtR DNA-binding winged helix domain-containing protein [Geodermatophilus sp. FMUSA9-8]|uniref:NrtR DNA-binding winged helix domain-containing protein n=1 Tax=Geodermatophilus sp. FMUSA9-8 TaxID=3120155 RepID=UPI00300B8783